MELIPCTVHPLKLVYLEGETCSGCSVLDVSFNTGTGVKVSQICFNNFYTASLTIKGKIAGHPDGAFQTLVPKLTLMKTPHDANEAQDEVKINLKEYGVCGEDMYTTFRFILRQPSPRWQVFTLENFRIHCQRENIEPRAYEDIELKSHERSKYNCSKERLVGHMESIKSMVELFHRLPHQHEPATFEMDGTYDVNLLSYS